MPHAALPSNVLPLPPAALPLLRLLWPGDWVLEHLRPPEEAEVPALQSVLHRPENAAATLHLHDATGSDWPATVAHVAAHRRFGGPPQPRQGLKPVQMALLGVLEDARVEWLACAELPGLRDWWRPFHTGEQARTGQGFEDLLARLSACLLDPALDDPHPWIARVRQLFFEPDGRTLALRTSAQVREAASRLGNDIGQMRLPFNARTYRVHARYRDDNTHLWLPSDEDRTALTLPDPVPDEEPAPPPPPPSAPADWVLDTPVASYPEWNHRSGHYRPNWTQVHETWPRRLAPQGTALDADVWRLVRPCAQSAAVRARGSGWAADGDELHPVAMIESAVAWRGGLPVDPRVWHRARPQTRTQAVLLLVDASVSTAVDLAAWQDQVRQAALALQMLGHRSAVWAFGSDGRHRVRMQCLKDWTERCEAVPWSALRAGGSTRMGAALRHAARVCALAMRQRMAEGCSVLLLTDGELHDIDVHDSAYLPADWVRAVREVRARGIRVEALLTDAAGAAPMRRALGPAACRPAGPWGWRAALTALVSASSG